MTIREATIVQSDRLHWPCEFCIGRGYLIDPSIPEHNPNREVHCNECDGGGRRIHVFCYGGGWQSTAALVLAARGEIPFRTFLFANVGNDSERLATIEYVHRYAVPFAEDNGIDLHELYRARRDGTIETLYQRLTRDGGKSLPIPMRMSGGHPASRSCTADFKVRVVGSWLKEHGANQRSRAIVGMGISLDEMHRANEKKAQPYEELVYPLLAHEPKIRRADCPGIITSAGLPVPPKSACWFCPLHRIRAWAEMRRDDPQQFGAACDLEAYLSAREQALGRGPVFMSDRLLPLAEAIPAAQEPLFDDEDGDCDNGWCMT